MLSTHASVWRFHRDDAVFRPDPDLKDHLKVKSADFHPATGRLVVVEATGKSWWSDQLEFLHPAAKLTLKGETLYKARWLTQPPFPRPPVRPNGSFRRLPQKANS